MASFCKALLARCDEKGSNAGRRPPLCTVVRPEPMPCLCHALPIMIDTLYLALICCVPPCPSVRLPFTWVRSRSGHCVYETQCARGKICDDTQFSSLKKEFLRRGSFVVAGAQFCCVGLRLCDAACSPADGATSARLLSRMDLVHRGARRATQAVWAREPCTY